MGVRRAYGHSHRRNSKCTFTRYVSSLLQVELYLIYRIPLPGNKGTCIGEDLDFIERFDVFNWRINYQRLLIWQPPHSHQLKFLRLTFQWYPTKLNRTNEPRWFLSSMFLHLVPNLNKPLSSIWFSEKRGFCEGLTQGSLSRYRNFPK